MTRLAAREKMRESHIIARSFMAEWGRRRGVPLAELAGGEGSEARTHSGPKPDGLISAPSAQFVKFRQDCVIERDFELLRVYEHPGRVQPLKPFVEVAFLTP